MTLSERLADYLLETSYEVLPAEVITFSKRMLADTLACAWAGTAAPGVAGLRDMVLADGGRHSATLWAFGGEVPAASAAFLNGVSAAALDFDCLHLGALAHSPIVVLPAVLALAEQQHVDGKTFLAAFTAGVELHCRLGMATKDHSGWFYTSMHGVLAAAGACARILGLDRDGICNAFGIALAQCGGTQQAAIEQTMLKRTQSALAAHDAVYAALLAKFGTTAPRQAFEGKCGFYAMYEGGDPAIVTDELGKRHEVLNITLKKFPSCGCNHAPIEAVLQLMAENGLSAADISAAETSISPYMARLVAAPYDPSGNALVAAQFSVQYSVASAIMRGRLGLAELETEAAREPAVVAFARSVKVLVDETRHGAELDGSVRLTTRDGRKFDRTISDLPGSPRAPLSDAEFRQKAIECFASGVAPLTASQAKALLGRIEDLDQVEDVAGFFSGLTGASGHERRSA
jgi:2-methylcitrate dehydratase PrpD